MKNLCIIPARGGSKRIPRKNIKSFLGKPIIAYSIDTAIRSGLFSEIMVSTDDEEIAQVAQQYGALVPFMRSEERANDFAPLREVIEEVKAGYAKQAQYFDYICCILPTAPLLTTDILGDSLVEMQAKNLDSIRPIVRYGYPIQRALRLRDGKVEMIYPEHMLTRSQDLEAAYHDAGMFYWMKYAAGLKGTERGGFVVSEQIVQDIDTEEDWSLAEIKFRILNEINT